MPGLDYFSSPAAIIVPSTHTPSEPASPIEVENHVETRDPTKYYNARLDPKNYLEGPLSTNPATRLRQMLARPGIVVSLNHFALSAYRLIGQCHVDRPRYLRRYQRPLRYGSRI